MVAVTGLSSFNKQCFLVVLEAAGLRSGRQPGEFLVRALSTEVPFSLCPHMVESREREGVSALPLLIKTLVPVMMAPPS